VIANCQLSIADFSDNHNSIYLLQTPSTELAIGNWQSAIIRLITDYFPNGQ